MIEHDSRGIPARPLHLALWVLAIGAGVLLFVVPLALRSVTLADEGYLLLQSLDLSEGKVLYRDMDAFVTPGLWFLLAGVFKLFGASVLISRVPVVIAYLALIWVSYRICADLVGRRAGLVAVAFMMMTTVWAFPAWTFAFYSPFAMVFALLGLERLLAADRSGFTRDWVLCGILFGLSVAFKQNYGVFGLLGGLLGVFALHLGDERSTANSGRAVLRVLAGVTLAGLPFVIYFAAIGAFAEAFQSLVIHPFEFSGKHDIPYMNIRDLFRADPMNDYVEVMTYAAQSVYRTVPPGGWIDAYRIIERLHVIAYWIPPIIFLLGAGLGLRPLFDSSDDEGKRFDGRLLAVLAVTGFLFLGVFPRADFNHLINVYQGVVVAGVVVFAVFRRAIGDHLPIAARVVMGLGGTVLTLYFAVAAFWYHGLMQQLDTKLEGERGGVKVNIVEAASIQFLLKNVDLLGEPGEALLTIPDIAMLNFLSNRPMPSAYYNLYEHHIAHDAGAAVAAGAEEKRVGVALTRYNDFFSDRVGLRDYAPVLVEYLQTHFEPVFTVGRNDYIFLARRPRAIPPENAMAVLGDCRQLVPEQAEIRKHLLFSTLYQMPSARRGAGKPIVVSRCRFEVPEEGGELRFRIEYPHPYKVIRPSRLRIEVAAVVGEVRDVLLTDDIRVVRRDPRTYLFPVPRGRAVDLSRFAGRDVEIEFRTTHHGNVVMAPTEYRPFGVAWVNPRFVVR